MSGARQILARSAAAALLLAAGCARPPAAPDAFEAELAGLERVRQPMFDQLYRRPGAELGSYRALWLDPVELAPDLETGEQRYRAEDLAWLQRALDRTLRAAFDGALPLVDGPGEGVLRIHFRLTQVRSNRLPLDRSRRHGGPAVQSDSSRGVGRAAVQLELRDAASGELLLAAVDRYEGEDLTTNRHANTTWGDAEYAFRRWAGWIRRELESGAAGGRS